ncbi:uncharacterized protein AMSG_02453 [Thecamonas trahens ATCC 50062]|uniref:tRNA-dihydrouridine(16/17) synthase [NAD(P)(+)] n=1 Tax=Thecamonas trahens ATCC 50062 TaxID=461836 RepID=A0A0L0D5E6_THETB|nr:hypothetical protein AMSG_02453 [Thecamonas trahens ATCC 50062]KNC47435.1 hypothetical protein AMSG_02453 [Thecamonas trahens ATCC 50062]|eukprot:XP_013759372.1 hypothetical protein AMSG_02453 [Thecamonas trahens ATCC 50062]
MSSSHIASAWKFYRSLGSPKYIVAPMVNASELAFRLLTRRYGAELCVTPMLNSAVWVRSEEYREKNLRVAPGDEPLLAQFCGNDPKILLEAALDVQDRVAGVDINLGCPQNIARRGHYGAFLLEETELLVEMVDTLARGLTVPVTCKIRVLESGVDDTIALCLALQDAGCSILTVHGRTRRMKKDLIGPCDWGAIKAIKEAVDIPVFANGGIECFEDIDECMRATCVDGVMLSEAILERPDIFANVPFSIANQLKISREYLALARDYPPYVNKVTRGHIFKFLHTAMTSWPELRPMLGKSRTVDEMAAVVERVSDLVQHELTCPLPATECPVTHSDGRTWYRRHAHRWNAGMKATLEPVDYSAEPQPIAMSDRAVAKAAAKAVAKATANINAKAASEAASAAASTASETEQAASGGQTDEGKAQEATAS